MKQTDEVIRMRIGEFHTCRFPNEQDTQANAKFSPVVGPCSDRGWM